MQCLKCGRDIPEGHVFCKSCTAVIEANPVKPGTPVTIPVRPQREPRVHKQIKPEDQIARLRAKIRRMYVWIFILLTALSLCAGLLAYQFFTQEDGPSIGQNYTAVTGEAPQQGGR